MAQKFLTNIEVLGKAIIDGSNFTSSSTVLDVQGTQGQLFSVTNSLTGDLFSVSDISGIPILNVNSSGLITIDGTLNLGDSNKIQLGASQDLQIYHDGSNSYISEVGTGDLIINGGNDIIFKDSVGNLLANMNEANSVELYYGGVKKFETTNTGVTITGNISATNFSGSSSGTNTGDQDLTGYLPLSAGSTKKLTDALYIQGTNTTNAESVLLRGISSNDGDWLGSIRTANTGGYNQEMRFYTSNANGTSDEDLNLTLKPDGSARFVGNIVMAANATVDGVDISGLPTSFAPTDAEANVQSDWTETTTTSDSFILNKPSTFPPSAHNHDGRYYTETESNAKFLTKDGSAKEWVFEIDDESAITGNRWYKVATVNKGNGGLHIRGLFSNHVEGFASQKVDLGIVGREAGSSDNIEITGQVDVLHNATGSEATDNCGIRIIESDITTSQYYHYFDVYVKTTRYQMLRLHLTKSGATVFHTSAGSNAVTTEPAPVSGGTTGVELDTSTLAEGNYVVDNSTPREIFHEGHKPTFAEIETTPTTLAGYGITDAAPSTVVNQTDFVSAASGGNFGGNLSVHTGAGTGSLSAGRTSDQSIKLHVNDTVNTIFAYQDSDGNSDHQFILRRDFQGTGASDFKIQNGATSQLIINKDGQVTIPGNAIISGDLTVDGTTTTLNTTTVEVEDNILQLNTTQGTPDTATSATSGISIYRGVDANDDVITQASLIFDDGDDTWDLTNDLTVAGDVIGASFAVPSGASTGFLKADGSVDSTTYLKAGTAGSADFIRLGYGYGLDPNTNANAGMVRYHKLAEITVGTYTDYNFNFHWSTRYATGKAGIHVHSDNDTDCDILGAWYNDHNPSRNWSQEGWIKYIVDGSTVTLWVKTVAWTIFRYRLTPSITEGAPATVTTYNENTTTDQATEPTGLTAFTNNSHEDAGYSTATGVADNAEQNVQADWNETTTTSDAFILNKPTIPTDFVSAANGGTFSGAISTPTGSTFGGAIKITETGTAQHILIGNQDSGGTDKPAMIRGVNGELKLGYGNAWTGEGGTMTIGLTLDTNSHATFAGNIIMQENATVDGVDISALPTTFAPTNAEANVNADWNSTSGDSQILNNPGTSYLTGVTDRHVFPGLAASGTQARRHHIGRVYYCPKHWDTTWQNLYFTINEETYNSGYIKYHLFGYYNGTNDQTLNLRVVDYRGNNGDLQRYKIVLGDHTDAGWDHSNQNVYYTDIYVEVSHYKSVKVVIDALGHSIIHSNPTSGAGITVIYETPTITNITTYVNETYDTTYLGSNTKIWNSANDGAGSGLDADTVDGTHGTLLKRINGEFVLDVNDDYESRSGTWSTGTSEAWGEPNISGGYAHNDGTGSITFTVPTGAQSCWISHLTWSSGGYVDVLGVQSDGGEVFLRRINTHQTVQNSDEGASQHDGSTITFAGTSLSSFGKIKFQNRQGRFHFTGIAFSSSQWEGTEGTGMIHPNQITKQGSGNGLDSDKLDGQQGTYYLNYANFTGTPSIPTDFVSATNGGTFSDDITVQGKIKAETFFSHAGTYTSNTHTNNWQKVYSHNWSTFSFSAFTLKVLAAGETANNNINADVHISYKMQNGQYRIYANIVNYGSEALLAENFQINLSVTSAASGSWTIWHKVIRNYQTPIYTMIGSGIGGTWYSETPVSSITGDNDTWTEKIISNSVSIDTDNSSSVGIGTTSASSLLEVSQQLSAQSTIDYPHTISSRDDSNTINQLGGEGVGIKFKIAGNDSTAPGNSFVGASIAAIRESSSDSDSSTGLGLFITQNDETLDEAVRIDHNGNVGIGTDTPDYKLDVEGDISLVASGENYAIMSPINQGMQIAVGDPASTSTPLVTFDGANQRVGIGTNNPSEKLDVDGGIVATGVNYLNQSNQYNNSTSGITGFGNKSMDASISYYDTGKNLATAVRGIVWTGKHYIATDYNAQTAKFYNSSFEAINNTYGSSISLPNDGNTDHPHGAAWDGRYLYVIQYAGSGAKIVAYDLDNGTGTATIVFTQALQDTTSTYDVEYAEGHLYTAANGKVSQYKLEGKTITHVQTTADILNGLEAQAITYDGSYLWITQNGYNVYQVRLDCTLVGYFNTGVPPNNIGWAWNGQNIATVNYATGDVYIINTASTRFDTEKFLVMGGDVGIGEEDPICALHVLDSDFPQVRINDESANGDSGIRFRSYSDDGAGTIVNFHADIFANGSTGSNGRLGFRVPYDSEAMTILSTGAVGINNTNPSFGLTLSKNIDAGGMNTGVLLGLESSTLSDPAGYRMKSQDSGGTSRYYQVLYNGDEIEWKNYNGSLYSTRMSLSNSGSLNVISDITTGTANISSQNNTDIDTGAEVVAQVSTQTYTAAFFDFVVKKGTNVRSGTVYACHDGTDVEFTETSTQDLGDTSDVVLSVDKSGFNLRLIATTTSDNWSVKTLIRAI
jgi:hypothetical protein